MKSVTVNALHSMNYRVHFVNSLKQFWRTYKFFSQTAPKEHNNLVFLYQCSGIYTLPDGEKFTAHSGDVVFAPKNSKYTLELIDFDATSGCTIGINLHLYDSDGEELLLSDRPFVALSGKKLYCQDLFERINDLAMDYPVCYAQIYSELYRFFADLTGGSKGQAVIGGEYASIAKAIRHLRSEDAFTMRIADMANECHVSESYLRRQFKKYSGMSPVKYIGIRKMLAAKNFLQYSDMSLDEIACRLNYTDAAYFCKVFHREAGVTPNQYRKQFTR